MPLPELQFDLSNLAARRRPLIPSANADVHKLDGNRLLLWHKSHMQNPPITAVCHSTDARFDRRADDFPRLKTRLRDFVYDGFTSRFREHLHPGDGIKLDPEYPEKRQDAGQHQRETRGAAIIRHGKTQCGRVGKSALEPVQERPEIEEDGLVSSAYVEQILPNFF